MKLSALGFAFICAFTLNAVSATETIPPAPQRYFNDYAGIVSQSVANEFDSQLMQFEAETSDQVVVAIFQKMQSDDDIAAYTQRVAEAWRVGQKEKRNGIVLFVFVDDRKTIIQVGYGLEGALPDVAAFNITEYQMKPRFAAGDYEGGLKIGIDSILNAIKGEYKNTEQPRPPESHRRGSPVWPLFFVFFLFVLSVLSGLHRKNRGYGISSKGSGWTIDWGNVFFFWINLVLSMSSSRGGGGSSSSGGGGFSGGGGSFGGGGAGSSW